jgi:MarR family 2-MHQ and catechol resistance regulon transcriptional repressor
MRGNAGHVWGSCLVGAREDVWLTPGSISVAVDRLEKKALVKRKSTDDRRVRLVELTAKGRALITKTFGEHEAAMEEAARVLSKEERLMLLRLLKKLGKGGEDGF